MEKWTSVFHSSVCCKLCRQSSDHRLIWHSSEFSPSYTQYWAPRGSCWEEVWVWYTHPRPPVQRATSSHSVGRNIRPLSQVIDLFFIDLEPRDCVILRWPSSWVYISLLQLKLPLISISSCDHLPGKSHGQRSLVGYSPGGHKELDSTEQLTLSH